MHHSQYQTDALDQYVDALLRDPDTPPPAALDVETAAVAKALVDSKSGDTADAQIQERVWSRVLFATYAPPELEPSYRILPVESSIEITSNYRKRKSQRLDVTFMVAAVFAVLCLTGLFVQYTDTARDSLTRYQVTKPVTTESVIPRHRLLPAASDIEAMPVNVTQKESRETALLYYPAVLIPE